jgi:hypothetical protein
VGENPIPFRFETPNLLPRMKILLQHKTTGLYLQQPGVWTRDIQTATDFRTSQNALKYIFAECMTEVQIVAVFVVGGYVESFRYAMHQAGRNRARI